MEFTDPSTEHVDNQVTIGIREWEAVTSLFSHGVTARSPNAAMASAGVVSKMMSAILT